MAKQKKTSKPRAGKKKTKRKSPWKRYLLIIITGSLFLILGGAFLLYFAVSSGVFGALPNKEKLLHVRNSVASELYTADGALIGRYFEQNRTNATYEEVPQVVFNALIATEDARYFEHEGIDPVSILRVIFRTILFQDKSSGGGSTISQQLAKNLFGRQDHSFLSVPVNKLKENIIALRLEEVYTKEEIIMLYLNTVPFGENAFGIKAGAERFFGKLPKDLTTPQAAVLIGMLKAPTTYNPRLNPEKSLQRRNVVLSQMRKEEYITQEEYEKLSSQPLNLNYQPNSGRYGMAPYLQNRLRKELEDLVGKYKKEDGSPYNLYTDGLKIYTTIHSKMQRYAEDAVKDKMKSLQEVFEKHWSKSYPWGNDKRLLTREMKRSNRYKRYKAQGLSEKEIEQKFNEKIDLLVYTPGGKLENKKMSPMDSIAWHQKILQAGMLALNATDGAILAYVGGLDHTIFPYDHVYSKRQAGSTFKPIIYTAALENGADPCQFIPASRDSFPDFDNYKPGNSDGRYEGFYSMKGALTNSINTISVKILMNTGFDPAINTARKMGITSELEPIPSLALGTADVSLFELTRAYMAFANEGKIYDPYVITRIETSDGVVLDEFTPNAGQQVVSSYSANAMLQMLRNVVDSGTARRIRHPMGITVPLAGKTGTTQNNADGWFISCTPSVVVGAWVGGEDPSVRFRSTALGQGANTALPIVGQFLAKSQSDKSVKQVLGSKFPDPGEELLIDLNCPTYIDSKFENFIFNLFGKGKPDREEEEEDKNKNPREKPGEKKTLLQKLFGKKKN